MKVSFRLGIFFLVCFLGISCAYAAGSSPESVKNLSSPASAASGGPAILFPETAFDFGELTETEPASHDFTVRNGGKTVLHINDVRPG